MKTVAIVGGGIGGLALANAILHHAPDWKVVVFEQAKQVRTKLGAGIGLQAGQVVLNELGFKEKLRELTTAINHLEVGRPSGEVVMRVDLQEQQKYNLPEGIDSSFLAVLRANLLNMLKDALPDGVIQLDKKFQKYEVDSNTNKVTSYFADGTSFESDVLVGADGIRSTVQQLTGHIDNNFSGIGAWYGVALLDPDSEVFKSNFCSLQLLVGERTLFGSYPCSIQGHVSFVLAHHMQEPIYEKAELEEAKSMAREFEQGHHYPKFRIVTDHAIVLMRLPLFSKPQLPTWHQGPVVLLGDASHATLPSGGQGGNQAIIDASILAKLLTKTNLSIDEALRKFYEIREPPTRAVVDNSDKLMKLFLTVGLEKMMSGQSSQPSQLWSENWNMGIEDLLSDK
jgi:salicylate hydroxylase